MLPSFESDWLCTLQAVLVTYFLLASILWTAALSHALHTVVIEIHPDFEFLERRYLMLTYGLPAISLVLPFVENGYGEAEGWCWISINSGGSIVMSLLCYYIPLVLVIAFNIRQYKKVIQEISENEDGEELVSPRLKFYPFILIFTQIGLTLHRIIFFAVGDSIFPLAVFGVLTTSLMGMGNAILYGFTEPVKNYLIGWLNLERSIENSQSTLSHSSLIQTSLNR